MTAMLWPFEVKATGTVTLPAGEAGIWPGLASAGPLDSRGTQETRFFDLLRRCTWCSGPSSEAGSLPW